MVQFQLKKLYVGVIFIFLSLSVYSQGPPRLRFTQLPQADSIGSLLLTNSQKNLEFTNNLRYLNNVFSVAGDVNFDSGTLYVDASTNRVGIGISSPGKALDINGSIRTTRANTFPSEFTHVTSFTNQLRGSVVANAESTGDMTDGFGSSVVFQIQDNTSGLEPISYIGGFRDGSDTKGGLSFWTATGLYSYIERMRITSNGNVGIGTTSPTTRLTIGGYSSANQTPDILITRSSSGTEVQKAPNITFTDGTTNNTTTLQVTQGRFGVWNYGSGSWNERMSIDASGNVGIGTTNPTGKLDIDFLDVSGSNITTNELNTYGFSRGNRFGSYVNQSGYIISIDTTNVGMFWDLYGDKTSLSNIGVGTDYFFISYNKQDVVPFFRKNVVYIENYTQDDNGDNIIAFNTLPANGKIGIGTDTPNARLQVNSSSSSGSPTAAGEFVSRGASGTGSGAYINIGWNPSNAYAGAVAKIAGVANSASGTDLIFSTASDINSYSTERMRLDGSGNLGIGTSSPQAPLSVSGSIHMLDVDQTSFFDNTFYVYNDSDAGSTGGTTDAEFAFFVAKDGSTNNNHGPHFVIRGNDYTRNTNERGAIVLVAGNVSNPIGSDGAIGFSTGTARRMQITPSGNVGIGTISPTQKLTVHTGHYMLYDNRYDDWIFQKSRTDNTQNMGFKGHVSGGMSLWANNNERVRFAPSGNVGIGTTSPSYKLHVNGSVAGVGSYVNLSDESYKKNVYDISYGINELKQLRPVSFNWINEDYGTRTNLGFIAQEVELVMPEIVLTADDDVKSIASTDLIPVLTKAVQEQQTIIEAQEQKIQELETLLQTLVSRVEILENQ